ncbi:MAG: ABC transporter permease [Proteobacteria bacterium]|nr:ABC transporter permease [Pseudomonadota bacterium]
MAAPSAKIVPGAAGDATVELTGDWVAAESPALEALVASFRPSARALRLNGQGIESLDTLGAYLLTKLRRQLEAENRVVTITGLSTAAETLVAEVSETPPHVEPRPEGVSAFSLLADIGEAVVNAGRDFLDGVAFLGAVMLAMGRLVTGRSRLRLPAVVNQLERVGLRGVPIVTLISFLVGAIIAQQSIFQLRTFGTVHFVADLLGILVLRELAVLLTAIMIAGRSGSSFTAELGSMKMREEVDALQTMGLDPLEVLVVPRILALIIALPLLTFLASMAGIAGGAVVAFIYGGVSADVFFSRLQGAIGMNTFLVGMIKAPFMALVIGLIACIEGFAVRGSAESLGVHTTASVVKSIFVVIVVDGLFAMFFAAINY